MGEPIRVAFIGAGDISQLHYEGIAATPSAILVGLWSRPNCPVVTDPAAVAERYGCRLYESAEAVFADPDVDVVFVVTNMETHAQYAIAAMDAGKHVLVEKPVASTVAELEAMKAAAERNGVVLMPGHNYIYEPWFDRTKQLIEGGELGRVVALYITYNIHHPEAICAKDSVQGVVRQIMTHHSYCTCYLMGKPVEVSAFASTVNDGSVVDKENLAMVNMRMAGGGLAHLQASFAADDHSSDPWSFFVKVIGTEGSARYSYNDWMINKPAQVHSHTYVPYPFTVRAEGRFFIEQCVRGGAQPLSGIDEAITCQKVIEAVEASVREGRHVKVE